MKTGAVVEVGMLLVDILVDSCTFGSSVVDAASTVGIVMTISVIVVDAYMVCVSIMFVSAQSRVIMSKFKLQLIGFWGKLKRRVFHIFVYQEF